MLRLPWRRPLSSANGARPTKADSCRLVKVPNSGKLASSVWLTTLPMPGTLHAFDAMNVSQELWNSDMMGSRDALGSFTKFANPTVANGKVYVPTASNQVTVYGLLPVPGIAAVVNAASFTSSPRLS